MRQRNSFLTPLVLEGMPCGKRFRLHHEFTYCWKRYGVKIRVPAGFETDLASIPRLARLIIPKLGRYNKAAVLHDFLYRGAYFLGFRISRTWADVLFLDAMVDSGVVKWKRTVIYRFVRLFGRAAWHRRT